MNPRRGWWLLLAVPWLGSTALAADEERAVSLRPERNAFWPVDHAPSPVSGPAGGQNEGIRPPPGPKEPPPPPADWDGAQRTVRISGISRTHDGRTIALIAGTLYNEGDVLAVSHRGRVYQFLIRKINDDGMELRRMDPERKEEADPLPPAVKPKEHTP
jgi:hypothetical protein